MIDIIIPIYNARNTIEYTLMSIKNQSIKDKINIYLIDDCSTETYDDILENYKELNIIYYRLDKNVGAGLAREKGLEISKSEYIMFIDSDDLLYDFDSVKNLYSSILDEYDYVSGIEIDEKFNDLCDNEGNLHAKMYRRSIIDKYDIKFNETRYHEDNYFNNLYITLASKKNFIKKVVYIYTYNKASLTNKDSKDFERLEILLYNIREYLNETKKRNVKKYKAMKLVSTKMVYINRIWPNFSEEEKNEFLSWLEKYNLPFEKYIGNEDYESIYKMMRVEFPY